jgi:hypothetical protein
MGRKRVPRNIKRAPVSISLPEKMIMRLDEILGPQLTRSRYIEKLIEKSIEGKQTKLSIYHTWECPCGHTWRTNNPQTKQALCKRCKGFDAVYCGIWEGDLDE